jgi:hypothetical protein
MEITKPNDILVASINNPGATTYDLMSMNLNPDNTSLYKKDQYEQSKFIQDNFKDDSGKFDQEAFNEFYKGVEYSYYQMTNEAYLDGLKDIQYSPFDIARPRDSKTYKVEVEYSKDYNPFKLGYSRTGINSITDNDLSLRELAQQSKV